MLSCFTQGFLALYFILAACFYAILNWILFKVSIKVGKLTLLFLKNLKLIKLLIKITQNRGLRINHVLDYYMKAYVFAFWFVHMCHCVFIQHGVSGGARLRLPWCTSSLCSTVWEQCAALSASLVPLGSLPQRQGLALFPLLYFKPLSLFHSLFNTHWALLSTSFAPLAVVRCLFPPFLIRNETLLHLLILPLPLVLLFF